MVNYLQSILTNPARSMTAFALISAAALAIAFISQYIYGLQPCVLCIYQRVPYAIAVGLGIFASIVYQRTGKPNSWLLGVTSIVFLAEMIIAAYHSGVERKWWPSFLEGCAVPEMKGNITDVLARIAETPVVRCDEIPWTDPVLGLSMANYNVMLSLGLCILALYALKKSASSL